MGKISLEQWQRFTALANRLSSEELSELIKKLEGTSTTPRSIQKLIQAARKAASEIEDGASDKSTAFRELAELTHDLSDLNAALAAARGCKGHPENRLLSIAHLIGTFVDGGYIEEARSAISGLDPSRKANALLEISAKTFAEADFAEVRRIALTLQYPERADVFTELLAITNDPADYKEATRESERVGLMDDNARYARAQRYFTLARCMNRIADIEKSREATHEMRDTHRKVEMFLKIGRYTHDDYDFEAARAVVQDYDVAGYTLLSLAEATRNKKDIEMVRKLIHDGKLGASSAVNFAKLTKLDSDIEAARKKASTEDNSMDVWRTWLDLADFTRTTEDIEAARKAADDYPIFRCESFAAIYKITRDPKDLREARQMIAKMTPDISADYLVDRAEGLRYIIEAIQGK